MLDEEETDSDDDDDSEYHDSYDLSYDLERDDDGYRGRGNTGVRAEAAARNAEAAARRAMMDDKIKKKMENMFKTSLDLADDEGYMEACEGVTTRLYPHQMRALYWMTQRENKFDGRDGVTGGILADDMGLVSDENAIIFCTPHHMISRHLILLGQNVVGSIFDYDQLSRREAIGPTCGRIFES